MQWDSLFTLKNRFGGGFTHYGWWNTTNIVSALYFTRLHLPLSSWDTCKVWHSCMLDKPVQLPQYLGVPSAVFGTESHKSLGRLLKSHTVKNTNHFVKWRLPFLLTPFFLCVQMDALDVSGAPLFLQAVTQGLYVSISKCFTFVRVRMH